MVRERSFWVYFLASRRRGALYVGVTSDVGRRVFDHRNGRGSIHVRTYQIFRLVRMEEYPTAIEAITREKQLKKWKRDWKIALIESENPGWTDLYELMNH
jgi:putative endonuclease